MLWTDKAKKILEKYWGFSTLKDKQIEVINELLLGNDVIGLLPTGYGKSMCYLLPPLLTKKAIIIISPLISLMDDQKDKLLKMNIGVSALHGNNKNKDQEIFEIIDGRIKIIYMSPEYLINGDGLELVNSMNQNNLLGYLAIDEAHCISVWGHDFRPHYLQIKVFREKYPTIPILAVTATATSVVVEEIASHLNLTEPKIITANFDRPNLYLKCIEYTKEEDKVIKPKKKKGDPIEVKEKDKNSIDDEINLELLKPYFEKYEKDKIIIYTNSRQMSLNLSNEINKTYGKISEAYHAGMSKGLREQVQTKFANGDIKIMVSTIAFGMGVDQIVRAVVIIGASSSIEEYWQQIGRAGRDNLPGETIVFFQPKSLIIAKSMLENEIKKNKLKQINNEELNKIRENNLNAMQKYFYLTTCRRKYVLTHFNQPPKFFTCNNCDNCCEKELVDITSIIWPIYFPSNRFIKSPNLNENQIQFIKKELKNRNFRSKKKGSKIINNVFLDLDLYIWKSYIIKKQYTYENLPDNLRIRIYFKDIFDEYMNNKYELPEKDIYDKLEDKYKSLLI
jgi:ATP-dependent DNA helicase RecQ